MSTTDDVLYRVMTDCRDRGGEVLETICEAIYELHRAHLRRETPPEPLGLACVIGDALNDARRTGAITADEAFTALREMLDWTLPMVEDSHDPSAGGKRESTPPLGTKGYEFPNDFGYPLETLYDHHGLEGQDERVPSAVVLDEFAPLPASIE